MAVQLTDRDYSIFRVIEEHGVLLEKHIASFLSSGPKPSFVRDRLRKLQYSEYVICGTHDGMLSWWKSPTKPLVYALSPMARDLIAAREAEEDLRHFDIQRHLLEVANLRMLFHIEEQEGRISDLKWTTCRPKSGVPSGLDAKVSFTCNGKRYKIGIVNHASGQLDSTVKRLESAVAEGDVELVCVISPDQQRQQALQKMIAARIEDNSILHDCVALAPHKQLYKLGVVKTQWQGIGMRDMPVFVDR